MFAGTRTYRGVVRGGDRLGGGFGGEDQCDLGLGKRFGREFLGREELVRLGTRIKAADHSVWEESWDDIDTLSEKDFFGGCRVHGQRTKAWFSAMHLSLAKRQGSILDVLCSC